MIHQVDPNSCNRAKDMAIPYINCLIMIFHINGPNDMHTWKYIPFRRVTYLIQIVVTKEKIYM